MNAGDFSEFPCTQLVTHYWVSPLLILILIPLFYSITCVYLFIFIFILVLIFREKQ